MSKIQVVMKGTEGRRDTEVLSLGPDQEHRVVLGTEEWKCTLTNY